MGYTITYRRKAGSHFRRVRRKDWTDVVGWIQRYGDGCSMIHIRNLEQEGLTK